MCQREEEHRETQKSDRIAEKKKVNQKHNRINQAKDLWSQPQFPLGR
jgi:hypothetical protein